MAGKLTSLAITMKQGKETKNTVRYEAQESIEPLGFDTLYIQKWAARKLNDGSYPETITVTIEV